MLESEEQLPKPVIGITSYAVDLPASRSAVNQAYIDGIVQAGGAPICIPIGLDVDAMERIFSFLDGLLLPGGDDVAPERYGQARHPGLGRVHEDRDVLELWFAERAYEADLPVLGICRGIQVMAVAGGGSLYQDLPSQHPSPTRHEVREFGRDHLAHTIDIDPRSHLAQAIGTTHIDVNSFHHQSVLDVPEGFVITASAPDGVVEGIESPSMRFAVGVQCHPEEMWDRTKPEFAGLFRSFVEATEERCVPSRPLAV